MKEDTDEEFAIKAFNGMIIAIARDHVRVMVGRLKGAEKPVALLVFSDDEFLTARIIGALPRSVDCNELFSADSAIVKKVVNEVNQTDDIFDDHDIEPY